MRQREFPVWIETLLSRVPYSCAEPEHVQVRLDSLRKLIRESTSPHEDGVRQLHDAALARLSSSDPDALVRALSCLFVVGDTLDAQAVDQHTKHPNEAVRKAAKSCLFAIRRRRNHK